jgi:hypothetical protein
MRTAGLKQFLLEDSFLARAAVRTIARRGPIAMLILVRDEIDIIRENIDFHLRYGIENFVVTDNGSVDGTRDLLADFEKQLGRSFVIIDDVDPAYHQAARVNRMIQIAKQRFRPRWIISSDADEFWYPLSSRYDTELDGRKNILRCFWHNFLPRPGKSWQEFTDIGDMLGYHGGTGKLLCLARGLLGMYAGNHDSRSIPRVVADSANIRVYHYPVRSYQQFERKVVQGHRAATKAGFQESAAWHWRAYYQAWEEGRLPQLYAELAASGSVSQDRTMVELLNPPPQPKMTSVEK